MPTDLRGQRRFTMRRAAWRVLSHGAALAIGFGAGIYALPILTAPPAPSADEAAARVGAVRFRGEFRRELKDSDPLHWAAGSLSVGGDAIGFVGRMAPGPDYKLYLSPEFVETEADFARLRPQMVRVGDVRTFDNFVVALPPGVDPARYTTAIIWCESFSQFISAARYRP